MDDSPLRVPHVARGRVVLAADTRHESRDLGARFATPKLELDELIFPRSEPGPAFDLPIAEVIDFLAETGARLDLDRNEHLREALASVAAVNPLGPRILENCYRDLCGLFDRELLEFEAHQLIGVDALDGWRPLDTPRGARHWVRAFPPRMLHVLAGNGPGIAAISIARGALTKGVHLLKLPSNDLFTATAILRTMADVDPEHPVLRSFSAAYWRGGDEDVESVLIRPQYFDKLVAWGGESAIRHLIRYLGPGLELISFDPKVSMSLVGREAFASEAALEDAARRGAADAMALNQDACVASRYQFVEGDLADVDRYAERLQAALGRDLPYGSGDGPVPPSEIRDEVEVLRAMEPIYRVFGGFDGRGLVVRSEEPVDFHPTGKTVNVVPVGSLEAAVRFANVATQTVGVHPPERKGTLRDALASAGVQRIVPLGEAAADSSPMGLPHDATQPLQRFMRWIVDSEPAPPAD